MKLIKNFNIQFVQVFFVYVPRNENASDVTRK